MKKIIAVLLICFAFQSCSNLELPPDDGADQEAAFYILRHTTCASCLTENGFMDCVRSCDFLLSDEGKAAIVQLHVEGIKAYVDSLNQD